MKILLRTVYLVALMISCHPGAILSPQLGMREGRDWELIEAAKEGNLQEVTRLIEKVGADIETRDYDVDDDTEYRPLHHAAEQGHLEVVKELVAHGANVNAQTSTRHRTSLQYACMEGHLDVVQFLKEHGAGMEKEDFNGGTAIGYAARAGHAAIVRYLHTTGADVYVKDRDDVTLLHAAAASGNLDLVAYCLQKLYPKTLVSCTTKNKLTPLHFASILGNTAIVELLLNTDKSLLELKDKWGNTALHIAARNGHETVVKCLLATGADPTLKNNKGYTPLVRANGKKHKTIVKLLEEAMSAQEVTHKRHNLGKLSSTQPPSKRRTKRVLIKE